jgi:hypothetical protein
VTFNVTTIGKEQILEGIQKGLEVNIEHLRDQNFGWQQTEMVGNSYIPSLDWDSWEASSSTSSPVLGFKRADLPSFEKTMTDRDLSNLIRALHYTCKV